MSFVGITERRNNKSYKFLEKKRCVYKILVAFAQRCVYNIIHRDIQYRLGLVGSVLDETSACTALYCRI